jgi:hypothetical protein
MATIHKADVLASWNFKHMVNQDRVALYNRINISKGHAALAICSPREIINSTTYEKNKKIRRSSRSKKS